MRPKKSPGGNRGGNEAMLHHYTAHARDCATHRLVEEIRFRGGKVYLFGETVTALVDALGLRRRAASRRVADGLAVSQLGGMIATAERRGAIEVRGSEYITVLALPDQPM